METRRVARPPAKRGETRAGARMASRVTATYAGDIDTQPDIARMLARAMALALAAAAAAKALALAIARALALAAVWA